MCGGIPVYEIKLNPKAEILSTTDTGLGSIPMSFRYENTDGNRFLILNVNTRSNKNNVLRHYARSRQYAENVRWLSGNSLPAYVYGNPEMYVLCKSDGNSMSVGLWNFFADTALSPVVELNKKYKDISFINCSGTLCGDRVQLCDIPPFGFAAFEVRK